MFKKIALFLLLILFATPVFADNITKSNVRAVIRTNDNKAILESYVKSAESKVNSAWHPMAGEKRTASVLLKVKRDGSICQAVSIIKSSGSKESDTKALRAVRSASPLGAFPSGTEKTSVIIYFNLTNQYTGEVKPEEQKASEEKPSGNNEEVKKEGETAENKDETKEEDKVSGTEKGQTDKKDANKKESQKQEVKQKTFVPKFSN